MTIELTIDETLVIVRALSRQADFAAAAVENHAQLSSISYKLGAMVGEERLRLQKDAGQNLDDLRADVRAYHPPPEKPVDTKSDGEVKP